MNLNLAFGLNETESDEEVQKINKRSNKEKSNCQHRKAGQRKVKPLFTRLG